MITCETSGRVIVTAGPWPHGRESTVGIPSSAAAVASPVVPDSESRRVTAGRLPGRARAAESGSAWQGPGRSAGLLGQGRAWPLRPRAFVTSSDRLRLRL